MLKIGVIPARFQTSELHDGQKNLINFSLINNHKTIIVLGVHRTNGDKRNPLSAELRKKLILQNYPNVIVEFLRDEKDDVVWSTKLDNIINRYVNSNPKNSVEVCLYGSRDSFIPYYHGKYKTESPVNALDGLSATNLRKQIVEDFLTNKIKDLVSFAKGVIFSQLTRFDISYQAVDVAVVDYYNNKILLGRKKEESKWRFFGGFVDVEDNSLEDAARRELLEESGSYEKGELKYLGSIRVNDWRYKNSNDKIMTAFYTCGFVYGNPKAGDDIVELKWFDLKSFKYDQLVEEHHPLMDILKPYLDENIQSNIYPIIGSV